MGNAFPWQLYRRFIFWQLAVILAGVFIFYFFAFDRLEIAIFVGVSLLAQGAIGFLTFQPLARIFDAPTATTEEYGEWFDVQKALSRSNHTGHGIDRSSDENNIYEATLHALHDAVVVVDRDRNIKFWNRPLQELAKLSTLAGLHLEEAFRDPDILKIFSSAMATGEPKRDSFSFRDGSRTRYFLLSVVPLREKSQTSASYRAVGIFNDITDIEKTETMRMEFVANVSHELRTPLTSLKGYSQAIESESQDLKSESVKKYAQIISRNVDRLIHLVSDLLDLSNLESGIKLEIGVTNTAEVTNAVLSQLEAARVQKKQRITTEFGVSQVRADRQRLEQVLLNLVQNAIKYIPDDSHIEIIWAVANEGCVLRVRDNGPGIDEEHLPRLFERFYRADKARSPDKGGTGLGLSIVKHIMQRHGGSVEVSSHKGQGTEFICRFPA